MTRLGVFSLLGTASVVGGGITALVTTGNFVAARLSTWGMHAFAAAVGLAALATGLLQSHAIAGGCTVRGEHVVLEGLVVRGGSVPLVVWLDGAPARARIGVHRRAPVVIEVTGSISFTGRRANIWYTVARPVTVAHGMVTLARGAQVVGAALRGRQVLARPVMNAEDVLAGEDKTPDETVGPLSMKW